MMKKTKILFIVLIILFIGCFLVASQASAQGIVPCGRSEDVPDPRNIDETADCTLCHFFILIEIILEFVFFKLVPPLALLMLIIGGGMFVLAAGNPQTIILARKIITSVFIGIVIIYSAFFLVGIFLSSIGLAQWTETMYSQWWNHGIFTIDCDVATTTPMSNVFNPPIEPTAVLISIPINKSFSSDGNLFTFHTEPIYSMSATGKITLNEGDSYVRIILTDTGGEQYLVYEATGPFDSGSFSFEETCEETCALDGIMPKSVDVELSDATLTVSQISTLENMQGLNRQVRTMGIKSYQSNMDRSQESLKIASMNQYIEKNGLRWTAGGTSVSSYSYEQKKKLMSTPDKLPNLQGFEYYKGGIFETVESKTAPKSYLSSNVPKSFDWRDRHGKGWMSPVKRQGNCGSCWAFAQVGTIEAVANLYFNQRLDLNLSEQQFVSCTKVKGCCGVSTIEIVKDYYENNGVTTESCFSYRERDIAMPSKYCSNPEECDPTCLEASCNSICSGWKNSAVESQNKGMFIAAELGELGEIVTPVDDELIKEKLIQEGPINVAIHIGLFAYHAMSLVGYDTDPDSERPIWIFKNSYGSNWGEQGYSKISSQWHPISQIVTIGTPIKIANNPGLQIRCEDVDNDGYCNWGISERKPLTCPSSCVAKKDCDDSNPDLGPFDSNYNCTPLSAITPDNSPPSVGEITVSGPIYGLQFGQLRVQVSDNVGINGCNLYVDDWNEGPMNLGYPSCQSCTAHIEYEFLTMDNRTYSIYAQCWDEAGNVTNGSAVNIDVLAPSSYPLVGEVEPTSAEVGVPQTFSVSVSDDIEVGGCDFFVPTDPNSPFSMQLSSSPCSSCPASITYTFTTEDNHPVWATCWDEELNFTAGPRVEIQVLSPGDCTCTDWTNKSCGGHDCALGQMWQTRSCEPSGCDEESQCIDDSGCGSAVCPNCWLETDLCESPPRCEEQCGAPIKCDEKAPDSGWSSGDVCHWCNIFCDYGSDNYKPLSHYLSEDACYYDCSIKCTGSGWECSENYKSESCPEFKTSDNQCYYQRSCTAGGCKYSKSDPKPCAEAVCSKSGWDASLCEELSCYTKTKSGSAQWLECNSGDVMVGWYHWTNNWGDDDIRIKCCELNNASLGSCSIDEKTGAEQWMGCDYGYVCTGKYHWTNNWGDDELKTKCCDIQGVSLYVPPCYTKEKSGSEQWIECNYGDVMINWYHSTNNWGDDDIKIRCCSIE